MWSRSSVVREIVAAPSVEISGLRSYVTVVPALFCGRVSQDHEALDFPLGKAHIRGAMEASK